MQQSLLLKDNNQQSCSFFTSLIVLMAMFLNQSTIFFGVNFSFADFFCFTAVLVLLFKNRIYLPSVPTLFFFIVSISVLLTAIFYIPYKFSYIPDNGTVLSNYFKLIVVFVYFILGYNISKMALINKAIRGFSLAALGIAIIGATFTIFNISIFSDILYYCSTRFRGLMNDPNYFSVLQLVAFVYFSREKKINILLKYVAVFLIILSILASGSKTGMVVLLFYLFFRVLENLIITKKKFSRLIIQLFIIVLLLAIAPVVLVTAQNLTNSLISIIPSFARVQTVFTDFNVAISEGGSSRNQTWQIATEIIKFSPVIGVGIGTYSGIANQLFGTGVLAHNTYLQISAEWGVPLAIIFFSYVFYLIYQATFFRNKTGDTITSSTAVLILRDILIVFLIASLALSLNNSRIFWLVTGALVSLGPFDILKSRRTFTNV